MAESRSATPFSGRSPALTRAGPGAVVVVVALVAAAAVVAGIMASRAGDGQTPGTSAATTTTAPARVAGLNGATVQSAETPVQPAELSAKVKSVLELTEELDRTVW